MHHQRTDWNEQNLMIYDIILNKINWRYILLNQKIRAKIKKKYNIKKNASINISALFDPFKKFEETKFENFKNSSKLEGIDIIYPVQGITLEEILAKHKKVS